ncbi:WD repeat-containing protein 75 [Calliphora vicina]|uniref:WD repeat-containing protein 75 n=1 Tax=Calliphora vicina TaxID=7373 RepID=UPI00325BFB33
MDFENEENDNLKFQHLAGGYILDYAPLYSKTGEHLLFMAQNEVRIYSTISGQFVRKLEGSTKPLIDFEFELNDDSTLVACNKAAEIFSWDWKTGVLKNTLAIHTPEEAAKRTVTSFKLISLYDNNSELSHAVICYRVLSKPIKFRLFNRGTQQYMIIPCTMKLTTEIPLLAVDNNNFPNLVLAQDYFVYFVNYKTWQWVRLMNAHKVPVTAIQIHPSEDCVATGDEYGKIFLWRQFNNHKTVRTSLYHWHHTRITSICFTPAGANFYSSGEEAVLVKWHIERPDLKQYIPRMVAKIRHIVVSPDNSNVVVCTIDNSIQIYGIEKTVIQNLQEFTYVAEDSTENYKFPTGLLLNPRNNSLVLNGRVGSLQFYNTYTKSLLYNINIVNQNLLSVERDRIMYDIRVTKAAFNIDWMATGEVFNDEEHLPELRLKFWKYQEESQNYALNTNIELPHEGGFKAIEFSNDYQVDNLLCATVGEDNIIKMWSLDDSDNIYKSGKTWYCIAQTSYKDFPVDSISFSQDGSLLAAGYGNTLCVYKSDNLKLKAALTGSNGLDGCATKALVRLPTKNINYAKSELSEKRKKIMQLFTNMLDTNEETLIKELQKALNDKKSEDNNTAQPLKHLDEQQKTNLYKKVLQMHELSLYQKVQLYQKLGITCKVHPQMETKLAEYLNIVCKKRQVECVLHAKAHRLNLRQRFKAKYRLHHYFKQQHNYDAKVVQNLVPILSLMNLGSTIVHKKNDIIKSDKVNCVIGNKKSVVPPKPTLAEITHVQFAAGEYAHLVVVCTQRRVLIWNLLTLRLQSVLKLSVKHLTFDPQTNLMAVVTHNNELHLFQPNVPLPIYQRRNVPNVYGIAWIPRRYPKQRSINLDWQAQSTLYFLNENQQIIYLSSPNEQHSDVAAPIAFDNAATDSINYTTFGTYATKAVSDKQTASRQNGPLVLGNSDKTAVKALIDMSVHTMPPMSLICEDFLKSMIKSSDPKSFNDHSHTGEDVLTTRLNGDQNGFGKHSDDDDDDDNTKMTNGSSPASNQTKQIRKEVMHKTEQLKRKQKHLGISENLQSAPPANETEENQLRNMAKHAILLDF